MNADNFLYKELTDRLLASAFKIHNALGAGFLEKVYENALVHELAKDGIVCEQQKALKVLYDGIVVGDYVADLVVDDKIIVELKAVKDLNSVFEAQLLNYLKATRLKVGYILNFGNPRFEFKRMVLSV
jgi:GxxExxY protein